MNTPFLTTYELAARWSMSTSTLDQWRWSGRGPKFLKVGGRVRYNLEDVVAFENQRYHMNTSTAIDKSLSIGY